MMKLISACCLTAALTMLFTGCGTSYSWRPKVPDGMRTVTVPTFRNESGLNEFGAVAARQVLREFQREGTFSIRRADEAALEIQGIVKSVKAGETAYNRRTYGRLYSGEVEAQVEVSVIDKREGRVLVDNRLYRARTTLVIGQDSVTAERDASGRLADELARQVVDDMLNLKW